MNSGDLMKVKILLLQARYADDPCRLEERESFAEKLGLPVHSIRTHDLLEGPPSFRAVRDFDALMMGGSGDFYVSRGDLPHFRKLLDLLVEVAEVGHPTFCSCFGFQCLVAALGGEILHDPANTEVGTYRLNRTPAGSADPLFGLLPDTFLAQMGRKDRAVRLPEGVPNLATSEQCPFQALRIRRQPVWATQFHPELDRKSNLGRFERYKDGYAKHHSPDALEQIRARFQESPEASRLLPAFLHLLFG